MGGVCGKIKSVTSMEDYFYRLQRHIIRLPLAAKLPDGG